MVQSVDGLVLFFFFLEVHNEIITAYIVYFTLSVALLCNPYICAIQIPRRATRLSARGCAGFALLFFLPLNSELKVSKRTTLQCTYDLLCNTFQGQHSYDDEVFEVEDVSAGL